MIRWREDHGRIVALSGGVEVGAVFPRPKGADWRFWIGGLTDTRSGNAKTILAAKCEIIGQFRDWLTRAALAEREV